MKSAFNLKAAHSEPSSTNLWRLLVVDNPVLQEGRRETRRFFRAAGTLGRLGPLIMGLIIASIYLWLLYQTWISAWDATQMYVYFELTLVTIMIPGSVYGAISGEREKGTWEALIMTRLTPGQIVTGKLIWRMLFLAIISVLLMIPAGVSRLTARSLQVGPANVFESQVLVALWGALLCAFGLWVSSRTRRSIISLTFIAITGIGLLLALPALYFLFSAMLTRLTDNGSAQFDPVFGLMMSLNPFTMLNQVLTASGPGNTIYLDQTGLVACSTYAVVTVVLLWLTLRRLRRLEAPAVQAPMRRRR